MAGDFDNTNRGALFKNDRKQRDNQPDYTGKVELGDDVIAAAQAGKPIYVSGWIKKINTGQRKGENMLSLSIQPPRENQAGGEAPRKTEKPAGDEKPFKEDDIPF